jgi:hypothetical protein
VPTASRTGPAESAKIISAFGISDGAGMTEHSSFCIDTIPLQYPFSEHSSFCIDTVDTTRTARLPRQHATAQGLHCSPTAHHDVSRA